MWLQKILGLIIHQVFLVSSTRMCLIMMNIVNSCLCRIVPWLYIPQFLCIPHVWFSGCISPNILLFWGGTHRPDVHNLLLLVWNDLKHLIPSKNTPFTQEKSTDRSLSAQKRLHRAEWCIQLPKHVRTHTNTVLHSLSHRENEMLTLWPVDLQALPMISNSSAVQA